MNYAQPGGLMERKQALIKALRSGRGGAGGAARLSGSTPFGAIPRLGFRPDARSVFNRNENFNFSNSPEGQQEAFGQVSAPGLQAGQQAQTQLASVQGLGPSSGDGGGAGVPAPQQSVSSQSFSGGQEGASSQHLLGYRPINPVTGQTGTSIANQLNQQGSGGVPGNVSAAFEGDGAMSSGISAWLKANPWYLEQMMGGGGGSPAGGGAVL